MPEPTPPPAPLAPPWRPLAALWIAAVVALYLWVRELGTPIVP